MTSSSNTSSQEETITIRLLLFAGLAKSGGQEQSEIAVASGSTVKDVIDILASRDQPSEVLALLQRSALAVNERYASSSHVLQPGDTLALIPPVSGG